MKRLIRDYFIIVLALYFVNQIAKGMVFSNGYYTFLTACAYLTFAMVFGKPVINLLLLPLNLVTFGLFRWVSSAVALYIVSLLVKQFRIEYFLFSGYSSKWFDIPVINVKGLWAFIGFSFLLSMIVSFLHWLRK